MAYRVAQWRILPKVMVALAVSMTNLVFAQTANGSQAPNGAPASAAQFDQWRKQTKMALLIPDPLPQLAPKNYGSPTVRAMECACRPSSIAPQRNRPTFRAS
jgi:hypothetical protein